jgi:SAM-dependent methyltransferase
MSTVENGGAPAAREYEDAIAAEGAFWDKFVAQRLLQGEIPGSIDYRLAFTQFRYNHNWRPLSFGPQFVNFRMPEIHYVLTQAVRKPGARVLDLGCGAGWFSLELARQGAHVTAVDISPSNLAIGRYLAETNTRNFPYLYGHFAGLPCKLEDFGSVEYVYTDLNTVNLPLAEYDAVVVMDSLHHVAEIERLLEQIRASLKPGGVFVGVDHAFATARTHRFNNALYPWLEDFYRWVTENDPEWFYEGAISLARRHDWGLLSVDYDATPVEGFGPFQAQLLSELLDVLRANLPEGALESLKSSGGASQTGKDEIAIEESPFEDVSAERLMRVLHEHFTPERFTTICPFIQPETHIPHYRHEKERIFQHYLACGLIEAGEQAIRRDQADGQWFLFNLTPEKPGRVKLPGWLERFGWEDNLAKTVADLQEDAARKNAYIELVEARREAELVKAREPRLPWKRRRK